MSTPPELDLATLNRVIAQLETDVARLEIERRGRARAAARSSRRLRYLQFARWFRAPAARFELWPLAVFVVGPLAVGLVALVLVSLVTTSWPPALGALLVGLLVGAGLGAALLYWPNDAHLAASLPDAQAQAGVDRSRLQETLAELSAVKDRLEGLLNQRRELTTAHKLQRAMLLQRDWKAMRGTEWEDFVVESCRTLGANVQRVPNLPADARGLAAPATGPRGTMPSIDNVLIVTFSPRRIAVAAISGVRPFHTAAVQQAANELGRHGCDALGIFTNCRVTTGSKELARSRNCTLVGEDEFPDFVLGKLSL